MLSSHAKVRAEVVPQPKELPLQLPLFTPDKSAPRDLEVLAPEPRKKPWAWLVALAERGEGDLWHHRRPDRFLVTDVVMPGLSGPRLAADLSRMFPNLRTLYISGYPGGALRDGASRPDGPLLMKPFTPDSLAQKVREVLDRPRDDGIPSALDAKERGAADPSRRFRHAAGCYNANARIFAALT